MKLYIIKGYRDGRLEDTGIINAKATEFPVLFHENVVFIEILGHNLSMALELAKIIYNVAKINWGKNLTREEVDRALLS